jgi:mannose-1-phosphate guanylyltransferase
MYAVIMAGGSGTRFWPASRKKRPKQFLSITGGAPLIKDTCDRLGPLARDEEQILVMGAAHMAEAGSLFRDRPVHLLGEPVGRNTAPCIGLGALYAENLGCEGPIAFMPADHYIADVPAFLDALRKAEEIAQGGGIVTLGIVPTRPETGYGYIRRGAALSGHGEQAVYKVSAFVEKPDAQKALEYLESREYYWNAGIFVAAPGVIMEEIRVCLPGLYEGLERLKPFIGTNDFDRAMEDVYGAITGVSFDYGVMEKTQAPLHVVPCSCGWSDVGSWSSLYELRDKDYDEDGNVKQGDAELIACTRSFVSSEGGRLVACLGLEDCLVVDTGDALLVADLKKSQDIRKIVERLEKGGKESLL